jgi:hypothetical protein
MQSQRVKVLSMKKKCFSLYIFNIFTHIIIIISVSDFLGLSAHGGHGGHTEKEKVYLACNTLKLEGTFSEVYTYISYISLLYRNNVFT